jgi:hypothetical protein
MYRLALMEHAISRQMKSEFLTSPLDHLLYLTHEKGKSFEHGGDSVTFGIYPGLRLFEAVTQDVHMF